MQIYLKIKAPAAREETHMLAIVPVKVWVIARHRVVRIVVRIELNSHDDMKMEPILITPAIQKQHPPHFQRFCSSVEGGRWFYLICCRPARKGIGETVLAGWELFGGKCHKFLASRLLLTNFLLSLIMNEVTEGLVPVWIHEQHCGQWTRPKVADAEAPLLLIIKLILWPEAHLSSLRRASGPPLEPLGFRPMGVEK
jgi:hypothetical protein